MRRVLQLSSVAFASLCALPANASTVRVKDAAELASAIGSAGVERIIELAPGNYGDVTIKHSVGDVVLRSSDTKRRAVFQTLLIQQSSGLTLEDLELDASEPPTAGRAPAPFRIEHAAHVTLRRLDVHASPVGTYLNYPLGMIIRDSHDILVEDSDFHHMHDGLNQLNVDNLIVRRNRFRNLADDGLRGGGSSNVLVEENFCSDNHPDLKDQDHPDCIQFWTANTDRSAHDITIRNNRLERRTGSPVQGIFVRDDHLTLPYQRLTITGNVIIGGSWNGIAVDGAVSPRIEGNVVCGVGTQQSWIVVRNDTGAEVSRNSASRIAYVNSSGSKDHDNILTSHCAASTSPKP